MARRAKKAPEPTWDLRLAQISFSAAVSALRGLRISGMEHIPKSGRVIVAVNHVSVMDPPLVSSVLGGRRYSRFLAKRELFQIRPMGWLFRRWGAIPLDRGRGDLRAVRGALSVLENEGCMVVFPEGTRSKTGKPGRAKAGVGLLARSSGAVVVPTRLFHTRRWLSLKPVGITFGEPLKFDESREDQREFSKRVLETIFKL